jgi:hypothetical protein
MFDISQKLTMAEHNFIKDYNKADKSTVTVTMSE